MANISKIEYSGDVYDIADQTARNSIGDLATLSTTEKTNLVDALNEVAAGAGGGDWNPKTFVFPANSANNVALNQTTIYASEYFIDLLASASLSFSPSIDDEKNVISQVTNSSAVVDFMRDVWGDDVGTASGKSSYDANQSFVSRVGEPGVETYCLITVSINFTVLASGLGSAALMLKISPLVVMTAGTFQYSTVYKKIRLPVFDF